MSRNLNFGNYNIIQCLFLINLTLALYEKAEVEVDDEKPNHLMVLISSDRGLCGGIHSSLVKAVKATIAEQPSHVNTMIVPCGDKAKIILQKTLGE